MKSIEVFSAGCRLCEDSASLVESLAAESDHVEVLDMHDEAVVRKAAAYGVRSVPAVAIDGLLVACCAGRGPDEEALRAALSSH